MASWNVRKEHLDALRAYLPAALGATQAHPGLFPDVLRSIGVNPRDSDRNAYLGMTTTWPVPGQVVFGFSYEDHHAGGQHDEDHYVLDMDAQTLRYLAGRAWEKENPLYEGTHHGDKPFLIEPDPDSIT